MPKLLDYHNPPRDAARLNPLIFPVAGGVIGLVVAYAVDMIRQTILLRQSALAGHSEDGIWPIIYCGLGGALLASLLIRRR